MPTSLFGYETDFWIFKRLCHILEKEFGIALSKCTVWRRLILLDTLREMV